MECKACNEKEGKILVCNTCLNKSFLEDLRNKDPFLQKENIIDVFINLIEPKLSSLEKEIERLRMELKIKKIKK